MKTIQTTLAFTMIAGLLLCVGGCQNNSPEGIAKRNIRLMESLVKAAEAGKPKATLKKYFDQMTNSNLKMQEDPELAKKVKAFMDKNTEKHAKLQQRMAEQLATNKELQEAFQESMKEQMSKAFDKKFQSMSQ